MRICLAAAALCSAGVMASAQDLPAGVTTKEVTFYSDHVACYAKLFFPPNFDASGSTPGVVLAPGWCRTSAHTAPFAAKIAGNGVVAMAIDYTGWGKSGGFVRMAEPVLTDDRLRFMPMTAKVRIKRTRLLPEKQLADLQNAISFLQGEPGVDRDRIGLWGNSFGGGHVIAVCAQDARVKAAVCQVPSIRGKGMPDEAFNLEGEALQDAIQLARTGKGDTFQTMGVTVDVETRQAVREYQPFKLLPGVSPEVPVLFITGSDDTVVDNAENAQPAAAQLKSQGNKVEIVEINGAGHDVSDGDAFNTAANAAANWFKENL